jgi:hypothetical protein
MSYQTATRKQITYSIADAWAAVAGADRINEQVYINKDTYPVPPGKKFNKAVAYELLENPGALTQEDRDFGLEMSQHFAGLLFRTLKGPATNGFIDTIANIVAKEQVTNFDVACMAALPKTYRKDIQREKINRRQETLAATSQHIGMEASKHELDVEIITMIYSQRYNIWIATATDGTNTIKFSTAHDQTIFPVGEKIRIKGSVKKHDINDRNGAKETWLTRVKRI